MTTEENIIKISVAICMMGLYALPVVIAAFALTRKPTTKQPNP